MQEEWVKWVPLNGLEGKYMLVSLRNGPGEAFGMELRSLSCPTGDLYLKLEFFANKYRVTNLPFYAPLASGVFSSFDKGLLGSWSFFEVRNSSYMAWLSEQSMGFFNQARFRHFTVLATNMVVDLVMAKAPHFGMREGRR